VIECDSYAFHMERAAFERDRRRDGELGLLGWRVLRITWAQLRYEPRYVIELLRRHLEGQTRVAG
jgi:very-short-patch-repair endonuclease